MHISPDESSKPPVAEKDESMPPVPFRKPDPPADDELLRKVERLTIYLGRQREQIDSLRNENEKLKKQISGLQNRKAEDSVSSLRMISDKILYYKARERIESAEFAHKKGHYYSCASNLYFALFNYMQSVSGKGQAKNWKHIGIFKAFARIAAERDLFPRKKLQEMGKVYHELFELRRQADYENNAYESYTIERLKFLSEFVAETLCHVKKS